MIPSSFLASSLGFCPAQRREPTVSVPRSLLVFLIENYLRHQPFHEETYLRTNPDVADAIRAGQVPSAKEHYVTCGYWEERDGANPPFCEDWYLRQNPDVAIAVQRGECPSGHAHYLRYGRNEGRCPCPELAHLYAVWQALSIPTRHRPN
ncbi:hypothetical protein [Acetobacter orleanensis]|uniref:Uncharacterized protein n=1 Tax=Acetobacter orleanensis TaxID=104099 RepID=A0A4Y3TNZ6_9PROT|nr:hypothetical protein [Acetobacter orleanensis]PCD80114.1 hypothetical protein CO710_04535 [Acetobacter orleanensis]GAN68455.1 hypothetical protein Abol_015_294 [Acetobacter orleanensis JCM 7639]GBR22812.1 hypothetical protein AA0473_0218 [Acetobacter orleanensis NRIC 0473]GEB82700.1 hypothetical protein AOR01nite_11770 [Acetobacter orleanensis]